MRASRTLVATLALAACGGRTTRPTQPSATPARADGPGTSIVVYPHFAVVRDVRELPLAAGRQPLRWEGVAKLVDATSLRFRSLTDPEGTKVVEQVVVPPVLSGETLLALRLGKPIVVQTAAGEVRGVLGAFDADRIALEVDGQGVRLLGRADGVASLSTGGGAEVSPIPAADWIVAAARGGTHLVEVSYQTYGLHWEADYTLIVEEGDARSGSAGRGAGEGSQPPGAVGHVELAGWATIRNTAGVTFRDARLELATLDDSLPKGTPRTDATIAVGPLTLEDRQSTRASIVSAHGVPATRRLVYDPIGEAGVWRGTEVQTSRQFPVTDRSQVEEILELQNDRASGLGRALPAGRVRVFARDADGGLRWLGEDTLPATAVGQRVRLRLGGASGLQGQRKQIEYSLEPARKRAIEEIELALTNEGTAPATITVLERMARGDTWKVTWASPTFVKDDPRAIRSSVTVPPGKTETLRYRVIWSWR